MILLAGLALKPSKQVEVALSPTPVASPTPSPTPKPLTFSEMNALWGPCVYLPVIMYHHVQDKSTAVANRQVSISVDSATFAAQMQYLKDKGYKSVSPRDLINFFDSGVGIPKGSVMITFDDAYQDFFDNARHILQTYGFGAVVFTPTGLVGNYGYMSWDEISALGGSGIYFANHTWSHKSVKTSSDVAQKEISTADTQLGERGQNSDKIFAYPYGSVSDFAIGYLSKLGYKLAFTTAPGTVQCRAQRLSLPRVRIGEGSMSRYGL